MNNNKNNNSCNNHKLLENPNYINEINLIYYLFLKTIL